MKKTIVVYNLLSGGISLRLIRKIEKKLHASGFQATLFQTSEVHEAYDRIKEALSGQFGLFDFVTVVGGDGIVNDAVNALAGTQIPLAVIPCGTGNSFAKDKKIPLAPGRAIRLIEKRNIKTVDLGLIDDERYFLMMCSSGFDVKAISNISPRLKRRLKLFAYVYHGLRAFFHVKPARLRVRVPGVQKDFCGYFCIISNIASYGIPMARIAPHASTADGKLDVCIFTSRDKQSLIKNILAIFLGQHINFQNVVYFQTSDEVIIEEDSENRLFQKVQIDGDLFREMPVKIKVSPSALNIFLPGR